jgi:hypothetical protein
MWAKTASPARASLVLVSERKGQSKLANQVKDGGGIAAIKRTKKSWDSNTTARATTARAVAPDALESELLCDHRAEARRDPD